LGRGGTLGTSVSIVMPAYNEEANVAEAIRRALSTGGRLRAAFEVVVVDDGSTDRTADMVRSAPLPVRLVQHQRNLGYGAALRTALQEARCDLILFVDSDNQFDLHQVDVLLERLRTADAVIGFRSRRNDSLARRVVAALWNRLVRILFRIPLKDIDCGFKLFRREALEGIDLRCQGAMASTELMAKLVQNGRLIAQVEVDHFPRLGGKATGMNPRVVARAFLELARMYPQLRRTPSSSLGVDRARQVSGSIGARAEGLDPPTVPVDRPSGSSMVPIVGSLRGAQDPRSSARPSIGRGPWRRRWPPIGSFAGAVSSGGL
jgi:hypothetical protein